MSGRFEGCMANFYDNDGILLATLEILEHDSRENTILVLSSRALLENRNCRILILTSPRPYACLGIIRPFGADLLVRLFRGEEKEDRGAPRFNLKGGGLITKYLCENKAYLLHTPIEVELVNISTSGVRLSARYNTMLRGDIFVFRLDVGGSAKTLTAEVMNLRDKGHESSEYGCVLMGYQG